jgi:hypothetical protein
MAGFVFIGSAVSRLALCCWRRLPSIHR